MSDARPRAALTRLAVVGSYPLVIGLGVVLYMALAKAGWPATVASLAVVAAGGAVITLHEVALPYRREWQPPAKTVGADALFMATVQGALPYALSITLVVALAASLRSGGLTVEGLWPHDLPIVAQACMMLLGADLLRYWLHRGFHHFTPMWRLHAVHHSPQLLYWFNVGRFHPIEKAVQYAFDTLPFALLGVSHEVLAAYFVFYALNGFYQHSNCRVRLGPLNYVVSGPELHRWHHSKLVHESNNNFGNNLIVWDVVFGTRFLPKDREVGELGLQDRAYPTGFFPQMRSPFIRGLENG